MAAKIFVNLPVNDLSASKSFFGKLGFSFNPQFTDESGACMVISDDIFAMLMTRARFKDFARKEVVDARKSTEVIIALSADSRQDVERIVDAALQAGGTKARDPEDHGFMFLRSFNDLDGHIWEFAWMDPAHIQQ